MNEDIYDNPSLPLKTLRDSLDTYRQLADSSRTRRSAYEQMARDAEEQARQFDSLADRIDLIFRGRIDALVREEPPEWRTRTMCGVATGSGLPCSRHVPNEGDRCWQHPSTTGRPT